MIRLRKGHIIVKLIPKSPIVMAGGIELIRVEKDKRWKEEQVEAEVTHVGPWVDEVKVGDRVVMSGSAGKWIDPGVAGPLEHTYRFVKIADILAVMEDQPAEPSDKSLEVA